MPLEFISLERGRRVLHPGDRGFLFSLAKSRWTKHAASEAVRLLKTFGHDYYAEKCPELEVKEVKEVQGEESEQNSEKKSLQSQRSYDPKYGPGLQFAQRDLMYNNCGFIASNLADPSDFAYYIMAQLADAKKDMKLKFPFRIMPVQAVCEARPKFVEKTAMPLIESTLGVDDQPHRFSLIYRGNSDGDHLTQKEAKAIVRSCVWAVNPNCVQCIKYQDYAIIVDILPPLFCIGIVKDFQRLAGYNTWTVRTGLDLTDQGDDSEDDISDDPTLDEEEEKRRKLRIKRKRHAEKAGLGQPEGEPKRSLEGEEEAKEEEEEPQGQEFEMQEGNEEGQEGYEGGENGV